MKVDGLTPQQLLQVVTKSNLESLNIGDLIKGRVVSADNGLLFLKLLDGTAFTASLPDGIDVSQGSLITLQITDKAQDKLSARLVNAEGQGKAQVSPDEPLIAQVKTELTHLMGKATDEMVGKVLSLLKSNEILGLDKAAFMAANAINPDQDMQAVMFKLAQKEFQIDKNLNLLKDTVTQALIKNENAEFSGNLLKPLVLDNDLQTLSAKLSEGLLKNPNQNMRDNEATHQTINLQLTKDILNALKEQLHHGPLDKQALLSIIKTALSGMKHQGGENAFQSSQLLINSELDPLLTEAYESLNAIKEKFEGTAKPDEKEIKQLIHKMFEKAFVKAEEGVPEAVELAEKVKALKDALIFANDTVKIMDSKSLETSLPVMKELTNAMQFFNQVSTYHTFVQLPLTINHQNTSGELYILRQKSKKGKIDPNQFTLFIALNTQSLGLVETFLNASNRYVTIHFRVDNEALVQFVKEHYKVLYEAFAKKGYKLADMKCKLHEDEPINLVNAARKTEEILGLNASVDLKI